MLPLNLRIGRTGSPPRVVGSLTCTVVELNEVSPHREGKESMLSPAHSQEKLLRQPDDSMARGVAKAELQRLGHVISDFLFDKTWHANVVLEKLLSALETSAVPSLAETTCD